MSERLAVKRRQFSPSFCHPRESCINYAGLTRVTEGSALWASSHPRNVDFVPTPLVDSVYLVHVLYKAIWVLPTCAHRLV